MKHLLSSTSYLVVNKYLAARIGLHPVVLLADLISKEQYFTNHGMIQDGYFYNTRENIERDTTLSRYQQTASIKILKDHNFIDTKVMGMPATTHYKILETNILNYLQTSSTETSKLVSEKLATNKNKEIIIQNNITFKDEVFGYDYPQEMLMDFYTYWSEPNKKGMPKYKLQKTWKTEGRLRTWSRNDKKWGTDKKTISSQIDTYQSARDKILKDYENKKRTT